MLDQYEKYYYELQNYLKTTDDDKDNLLAQMQRGHEYVKMRCGDFDMDNINGRNLVFDWVRFAINGYSEHFESSFLSELSRLGFELWEPGGSDVEET